MMMKEENKNNKERGDKKRVYIRKDEKKVSVWI